MALLTTDQITQNIINQLQLLDPAVSAEVGTPERKIIEATAELIASQQVDFSVLNSQTDLSSLSGGRLDAYLAIFNFGRQQATPSYGTVTFSRTTAPTTAITIPLGTQVIANIDDSIFPQLTFVTTQTVVFQTGTTSVSAPVQCTIGGSIGNIAANTIVGFGGLAPINGISSVSNKQAFSGGTDQEDDATYVSRFKNSFLRNISGTTDMYLALAVSLNGITKANVVGPISRYQEYVQVPTSDDTVQVTPYDTAGTTFPHKRTSVESTIPYSKYTYATNFYVTDGTLDPSTAVFFRPGVDYIFNAPPWLGTTGATDTTNLYTPNLTFLNPFDAGVNAGGNTAISSGSVLFMEHAYISKNSRNDYNYGVLNCVDVFVNGENAVSVDSVEVVPTSANNTQGSNTHLWTFHDGASNINFVRKIDGRPAALGSRLQPLYWQPVLDVPDTIQVGTNTYYKANFYNPADSTYYNKYDGSTYSLKAHYIVVEEVSSYYGTIRARSGIEWFLAGANYLNGQLSSDSGSVYSGAKIDTLAGTQFNLTGYTYDKNVSDLQAIMEKQKQTTTDVLVHKAKLRYFRPIITVMYSFGATQSVVNASIISALENYFSTQYYGVAIQLSDILQVIHNVPGVDNVRWTNQTTGALEEVNADGSSKTSPVFITNDFFIQDNELASSPSANQVTITVRAQNTWSS